MAIHYDFSSYEHGFTCSGDKVRPNYKPQYNENGSYELVEDGLQHCYEDIQSWLPSTDLGTIINTYLKTGDAELLQRRAGFYADVTDLPKNYGELHNMLQNADNIFLSLPLEVRESFGNSAAVFYKDPSVADEAIRSYLMSKEKESDVPAPEPVITPVEPVGGGLDE